MPASPFGLAYGIGAGLSGIPAAVNQGKEQAIQMAMNNTNLQKQQMDVAQQMAMNQAYSTPVNPQMDQPTQQQAMGQLQGNAPQMSGGPAVQGSSGLPDVPSGGVPLGPGTVASGSTSLADAGAPVAHKYTTQYEKMAYELNQRAQTLQQRGFGLSAQKLSEEAVKYGQMHMDTARGQAAQAILSGNKKAAIENLHSIGMDVKDVGKTTDADGNEMFYMTGNDGKPFYMTKEDVINVGSDPSKFSQVAAMQNHYKNQLDYNYYNTKVHKELATDKLQAMKAQKIIDWENRFAMAKQKGLEGPKATAFIINSQAYAREHNMKLEDAQEFFLKRDLSVSSPSQYVNTLKSINTSLAQKYGGYAPDPNSADPDEANAGKAYKQNIQEMQETAKGAKPGQPKVAAPTAVNVQQERVFANDAIKQQPQNEGLFRKMFKAKTGEDL